MKLKVGHQGIKYAYSYIASTQLYGPESESVGYFEYPEFKSVLDAVSKSEIDYGVIPVENSYAGRVSEIHNILPKTDLYIVAEKIVRIEHALSAKLGVQIGQIKKIYSHEQAIMQCENTIKQLGLSAVSIVKASNTAVAAKMVSEDSDPYSASISSQIAAVSSGLNVLKTNIEDSDQNYTTFISLAKNPIDPNPSEGHVITSIIFTVRNIPASIYKAIGGFATNGVNLLKLESYIPGGVSSGSAQFFLSFFGHPNQANVKLAMEELGFFSIKTKLLGVYYADNLRFSEL